MSRLKLVTLGPLPANDGLFGSTSSPLEPELGVGRDVLSLSTFPTSVVAIARKTGPKIPPFSSSRGNFTPFDGTPGLDKYFPNLTLLPMTHVCKSVI